MTSFGAARVMARLAASACRLDTVSTRRPREDIYSRSERSSITSDNFSETACSIAELIRAANASQVDSSTLPCTAATRIPSADRQLKSMPAPLQIGVRLHPVLRGLNRSAIEA